MLIALSASRSQKPQVTTEQTAKDDEKRSVMPVVPNVVPEAPKMPSRSPKLAAPKTGARQNQQRGVVAQKALQDETDNNATTEIATDFIPLTNRESLAQMDGGQVMRVELPRSALMSFGLPMDMERASERIKADVVVGNDGLARAIRFVR